MSNVNNTLLNKLFLNVNQDLTSFKIYSQLRTRIFPNENEYIEFLSVTDVNEKLESAKRIIRRLCFESNFPPPSDLIINIAKHEADKVNIAKTKEYIPRDHFIHKVNTYILGIYLAFYHPTLSNSLNNVFIDKRIGDNFNRTVNSYKDFISSWKSFCLYHDLGYPIQISYPKDGKPIDDTNFQMLEIFNNLYGKFRNELSLEALAKLVAINRIIIESERFKGEAFVGIDYNFSKIDNVENRVFKFPMDFCFINEYCELIKVRCFDHLKLFLGFVAINDIILMIYNKITGQPLAFQYEGIIYRNIDIECEFNSNKIFNLLNTDEQITESDYEIKYYVKNLRHSFEKCLPKSGEFNISNNSLSDIEGICSMLNRKLKSFNRVHSPQDLSDYIFNTFDILRSIINNLITFYNKNKVYNLDDMFVLQELNKRFCFMRYIDANLTSKIKENFNNLFDDKNKITKLNEELCKGINRSNITNSISNYVKSTINNESVKSLIESVVSASVEEMISDLQSQLNIMGSVIRSYATIAKQVDNYCIHMKFSECVNKDKFDFKGLLNYACKNENTRSIVEVIKEHIKSYKKVPFDVLLNKYVSYSRYDHGICSAMLYLYINALSTQWIESLEEDTGNSFGKCLETLFWAIDPKKARQKLITNYKHVQKEAAVVILCHNIKSTEADRLFMLSDENKWITKLENEPFEYFCRLCDELQNWDRRMFYDAVDIDYAPLLAMDTYDITIKDDRILISIKYYTPNYENIVAMFNFDKFLANSSNFISVGSDPRS